MEQNVGDVTNGREIVRPAALPRDLLPRVLSGAVLAVLALAGNWAGHIPFACLVLLVALVMSWEWSGIVRGFGIDAVLVVQSLVVAVAVGLTAWGAPHLGVTLVLLGAIVVYPMAPRVLAGLSALGVVYVGLPAIALIWLRGADGLGAAAIFFIFAIVWTTDTFAYLCGRAIGGPKLWPAMSPRKTWAGTLGGIAFAAVAGAIFATQVPGSAPMMLALVAVLLSIVAQAGDLAESALKRAFDVKNASDLIPGHGGFMDRMDGIVTAASLAALIAAVRGAQTPAQSLLFWS